MSIRMNMTTTEMLRRTVARVNFLEKQVNDGPRDPSRYYGAYNGRFHHKGVAIAFDAHCTYEIVSTLIEMCPDLGKPDQMDTLGFQALWSWDRDKFTDGETIEEEGLQ
jgi:hypothetical protein